MERRYIRSALRAFAKRGFFGTTMNHIADEAGVSQPRISQVFDGKLSAYLAAHEIAINAVIEAFEQAPTARTFDPAKVGHVITDLLASNPAVVMMTLHTVCSGQAEPRIADAAREALGNLTEILVNKHKASPAQARDFLATGFFTMILISSGLPDPEATDSLAKVAEITPGVVRGASAY